MSESSKWEREIAALVFIQTSGVAGVHWVFGIPRLLRILLEMVASASRVLHLRVVFGVLWIVWTKAIAGQTRWWV